MSTLVRVTFGGYAGSRMQPSEDAEAIIECDECGTETDAYLRDSYAEPGDDVDAWCQGAAGHEAHETTVTLPDDNPADDWDAIKDDMLIDSERG